MHELPRDLVTILRTEAKNHRTPPIDYVIAEDGGRMVHRPEPDIAMAELLEEAAAALAARDAELAAVRANRTDAHGWLFNNPDTGIEWLDQHPIESGEVPDAENVRPASAEEMVTLLREAWNALAAERAAREKAEAQLAEARKVLVNLVQEIDDLVSESEGVAGLHLNGDVAEWCDLLPGGPYERLTSLDDARAALKEASNEQS